MYRESKKKEKESEIKFISYESKPSFHGLNTRLDVLDFLVDPENKNGNIDVT